MPNPTRPRPRPENRGLGPLLGAHMSIAGGYHLAVERAAAAGCDCVQLFTKNNNQWKAKPIHDEEANAFRSALSRYRVQFPLSHASYLINLASPDSELWQRSLRGWVEELERAETLSIFGVVLHPGAAMGQTEAQAIKRIVRALDSASKTTRGSQTLCLLETTAGQGSSLGWRIDHLARILDGVRAPERIAVCLDTCHVFAAGYDVTSDAGYGEMMDQFEQRIGLARIRAFHLNDSKTPLGSRVDRHEHIGRGCLGPAAFRSLLNDDRFRGVPMYLETPKGIEKGRDLDRVNLQRLRRLVARRP